MPTEKPVIELVPKSPFKWRVIVSLVVLWLIVLTLAFYTKNGLLRLLLPLIIFTIILYVGRSIYLAVRRR